jgi:hypothetical protein
MQSVQACLHLFLGIQQAFQPFIELFEALSLSIHR